MKEVNRWMQFVDWLDFVVLRKLGLIRLKHHRTLSEFYQDWLIDLAKNESISEKEKNAILAMERNP